MDVGIRELKQHLSEIVERASRGEVIRVTDRGRPKAMLTPLPGRLRIEEGLADGWITRLSDEPPRPARPHKGLGPIMEVLDEDRGD